MALRTVLLLSAVLACVAALHSRERVRLQLDHACELSSCYPATGNLLIGRQSQLTASSTCGVNRESRYCIVSHLEEKKKCFRCLTNSKTENDPLVNHRVQNIIYKYHPGTRTKSWWQSENGRENVTVQLDLESEFHFTHLIIEFKTFRPSAMLVERSSDFGKTWRVYRYFAHNCDEAFPWAPKHSQQLLTEVVCESRYSGVAPSTEGEIIFKVIPPNINVTNIYSAEVQNLLKLTNLRINFTKLHTLGDDLLDNRADIQEKYYYAISEMIVRGSCSCYGHASRCLPMPGVESKPNMVHGRCECTHNTRGLNCQLCEDFYNDLPWQPAARRLTNACQICTCNNHATSCHFNETVFKESGNISGGVCDGCLHNTMGNKCEMCKEGYFQDPNLDIQHAEICKPCDCDQQGSVDGGLCDSITDIATNREAGHCHCKANVGGQRCDMCKDGFWNFDTNNPEGCEACTCNPIGTVKDRGCDPNTGECTCKRYVSSRNCDQCLQEFYGLSESDSGCSPCDCNFGGSLDNACDVLTGQCKCRLNITGRQCDQPFQHHFSGALDFMVYEAELGQCDSRSDVNSISGQLCQVVIREPFRDGREETWTGIGFMKVFEDDDIKLRVNNIPSSLNYNLLIRYEPQLPFNWQDIVININRLEEIGYDSPCANTRPEDDTKHAVLLANQRNALIPSTVCLEKGKSYEMLIHFGRQNIPTSNARASILIDSVVLIPDYKELPFYNDTTPANMIRRTDFEQNHCNDSYYYSLQKANIPEVCKKHLLSIGFYVLDGARDCHCDPTGSTSYRCKEYGGNCPCKTNVIGQQCNMCAPGTYGFSPEGCKACDCNNIGALDNFCDANSGQCKCRANTYGRQCDECQPGYFNFPNCQQCDCNGHAETCDSRTGACIACRDNTEGHRCERCSESYYGDPRLGVDIPCRACPCPGTKESSHSFANTCYLDEFNKKKLTCECQVGYAGLRCDVCADNYYGHPETPGGSCQVCECNNNVDLTKPGNCDPQTGKCLQCLSNTAGDNCEVCREGYYGDALTQSCQICNCSPLGTNFTLGNCDSTTGECPCLSNVLGMNCDQCAPNHWRIALGKGCDACDCDSIGSESKQCNLFDGQCTCVPGFGGRQCDECQENHWGNPNMECHPCDCDSDGSESQQCKRDTGSCICKPGIGGVKCDMCARGYLGDAPECYACGECFDNWDRIINGLHIDTTYAVGNASQIKVVGATGAYTRDFNEMDAKLLQIENDLNSVTTGETEVKVLMDDVDNLHKEVATAEQKVADLNANLSGVTAKIYLNDVTLNGLRGNLENLNNKTQLLNYNATKLQEANLEGALNLTRDAKQRATKASDDAENLQKTVADTDRQMKATDLLVQRHYSTFNNTQSDNDNKLAELQEQLTELESELPKLNENMCGQTSDTCRDCGGAGCGSCGGISCGQGAVTKADEALEFANKTQESIKEHELTADDLLRSISQAKQGTATARQKSEETLEAANQVKALAERLITKSQNLTSELQEFLGNSSATPEKVRALSDKILNISINLQPEEITNLSQRINATVSQLTNIENIIAETQSDLDRAKDIKSNATTAEMAANLTLSIANTVLKALYDAQVAQDSVESIINSTNNDIEIAEKDLIPIADKTNEAQMRSNATKDEIVELQARLVTLQKNILKIESDAQKVKAEAAEVVEKAEGAEEQARILRQSFKEENLTLSDLANKTSNSRNRAQALHIRATMLASKTQSQLKELQNMEDLYNSHTSQLEMLEKQIGELNANMADYLSQITQRSAEYRSCTT